MAVPTYKKIGIRFRQFKKEMYDAWEAYCAVEFYFPRVHKELKEGRMSALELTPVGGGRPKRLSHNNTFGAISQVTLQVNGRNVLLSSVSAFEYFLGDLVTLVYRDYPRKLLSLEKSYEAPDSPQRRGKLLDLILESSSRDELLDRLIEERVRAIFYGNILDFFAKDTSKLEFGEVFRHKYPLALRALQEIIARRNIYAHNNRRVDRKYLREVPSASLKLNQIAAVSPEYVRGSINLMIGFAATAVCLVLKNIYKAKEEGLALRLSKRIERPFIAGSGGEAPNPTAPADQKSPLPGR